MDSAELNTLHTDPKHWHLLFFYFAPADPRIVVKKRFGIGWTLNFARPLAIPFFVGLLVTFYASLDWLSRFNLSESAQWYALFAIIFLLISACAWLANPRRYDKGAPF